MRGVVLLLTIHAAATAAAVAQSLPNLRRVTTDISVGGEPADPAGFDRLAVLGVRTVVSVDGAVPNVAAARSRGMRVIHVPLGYDGVGFEACAALTRIAAEAPRPIYVHCHHGLHRGPAAAAILARATGDYGRDDALRLLREAGTDPEYVGLWRDVTAFSAADYAEAEAALVETSPVDPFVAAMAQLGRAWKRLRARPADRVARRLMTEALRESLRAADAYDPSGGVREGLEGLSGEFVKAETVFAGAAVDARCAACHDRWRGAAVAVPSPAD